MRCAPSAPRPGQRRLLADAEQALGRRNRYHAGHDVGERSRRHVEWQLIQESIPPVVEPAVALHQERHPPFVEQRLENRVVSVGRSEDQWWEAARVHANKVQFGDRAGKVAGAELDFGAKENELFVAERCAFHPATIAGSTRRYRRRRGVWWSRREDRGSRSRTSGAGPCRS